MSAGFADHFSARAGDYARYRPHYPAALYERLDAACAARALAWDCACGSGQATAPLAARFARVVASDASHAQLVEASVPDNVIRVRALAECAPLADACVDLLTVAQAAHWFDLPAFYAEARRVLKPGGVLALWTYNLLAATPALDAVIRPLHDITLGPWWPASRRLVDEDYRAITLPFARRETTALEMSADWAFEHLVAYLGTWSAVERYRVERGVDPLGAVLPGLRAAWGGDGYKRMRWPVTLKLGWRD